MKPDHSKSGAGRPKEMAELAGRYIIAKLTRPPNLAGISSNTCMNSSVTAMNRTVTANLPRLTRGMEAAGKPHLTGKATITRYGGRSRMALEVGGRLRASLGAAAEALSGKTPDLPTV